MNSRASLARILIVDDDPEVNDLLRRILINMGYRYIETAACGKEAIKKAEKEAPDLILLDLRLPDIDGGRVFRRIKELHKDTPVIVITGYPESGVAHRMTEEGIADFITKPFDLIYFKNVVSNIISQHIWKQFEEARRKLQRLSKEEI